MWVGSESEKKRLFDARKWKFIEGEESIDEKWEGTVCATFVVVSRVRIRRVTSLVCQLDDQLSGSKGGVVSGGEIG